jgi:hypothetical protein
MEGGDKNFTAEGKGLFHGEVNFTRASSNEKNATQLLEKHSYFQPNK